MAHSVAICGTCGWPKAPVDRGVPAGQAGEFCWIGVSVKVTAHPKGTPPALAGTHPVLGAKFDHGKLPFHLLPWASVTDVVRVLQHGAEKYAPDNWQLVPEARTRYFPAAMRHLVAWQGGELVDPDSGLPHLAHAATCLLFLRWFERRELEARGA